MPFLIYDYLDEHGKNAIQPWIDSLQVKERGKLNQMLDKLQMHGVALRPQMLAGTNEPGISKLRIHGKVQLRPLLCSGPVHVDAEYTILSGAKEVGGMLVPKGIEKVAASRKLEVKASPTTRRKLNARCTK